MKQSASIISSPTLSKNHQWLSEVYGSRRTIALRVSRPVISPADFLRETRSPGGRKFECERHFEKIRNYATMEVQGARDSVVARSLFRIWEGGRIRCIVERRWMLVAAGD